MNERAAPARSLSPEVAAAGAADAKQDRGRQNHDADLEVVCAKLVTRFATAREADVAESNPNVGDRQNRKPAFSHRKTNFSVPATLNSIPVFCETKPNDLYLA
jgi:hypothetical protein